LEINNLVTELCIEIVVTVAVVWTVGKILFTEQRESGFFLWRWNPAQRILFMLCFPPLIFFWPYVLLV